MLCAAAHDIEENLFQGLSAMGLNQGRWHPIFDDAAFVQENDTVSEPLHLSHVVRSKKQRGPTGVGILLELPPNPIGGIGIERGGGLVEEKQLGRIEQGLGEAHACLLPSRQLAGRAVKQRLYLQIFGDIGDALSGIRDAVKTSIDGEVLLYGQAASEGRHKGSGNSSAVPQRRDSYSYQRQKP